MNAPGVIVGLFGLFGLVALAFIIACGVSYGRGYTEAKRGEERRKSRGRRSTDQ